MTDRRDRVRVLDELLQELLVRAAEGSAWTETTRRLAELLCSAEAGEQRARLERDEARAHLRVARADALSLASSVRRHEEPDAEVVERALLYRVGP